MKCPLCGSTISYLGILQVDCTNKTCRNYRETQDSGIAPKYGRVYAQHVPDVGFRILVGPSADVVVSHGSWIRVLKELHALGVTHTQRYPDADYEPLLNLAKWLNMDDLVRQLEPSQN